MESLFDDGTAIDQALKTAVREAVLRHKRLGQPIVEWRDGRVVLTPPEEIVVDEPPLRSERGSRARRKTTLAPGNYEN